MIAEIMWNGLTNIVKLVGNNMFLMNGGICLLINGGICEERMKKLSPKDFTNAKMRPTQELDTYVRKVGTNETFLKIDAEAESDFNDHFEKQWKKMRNRTAKSIMIGYETLLELRAGCLEMVKKDANVSGTDKHIATQALIINLSCRLTQCLTRAADAGYFDPHQRDDDSGDVFEIQVLEIKNEEG